MKLSKLKKYKTLGFKRILKVLYFRILQKRFKESPFPQSKEFQKTIRAQTLSFVPVLYSEIKDDWWIQQAEGYSSGLYCFFDCMHKVEQLEWHTDICLKNEDKNTDSHFSTCYYKELSIPVGKTKCLEKDIRGVWQASRFLHFFALGKAYQITKDEKYASIFIDQINDWINANPYKKGPNWICPMEVALRAINWIVAWEFFKHSSIIEKQWADTLAEQLYLHMQYIEQHWEFYDSRTNNHYLTNLVGYLYLCWFFRSIISHKKIEWCITELKNELEKQIMADGTSYEGSTSYHRFVTELVMHAQYILKEMNYDTQFIDAKLPLMQRFVDACSFSGNDLVTIGDNDGSTVLLLGIEKSNLSTKSLSNVNHFNDFGLSIIKTTDWHVTLRHHAYNELQPSGHFHADAGSITVAYKGIPIIIDPGSYVYCASAVWRNDFRSVAMHSSFYLSECEKTTSDTLFALTIANNQVNYKNSDMSLYTEHQWYRSHGLKAQRSVYVDSKKNRLYLLDSWADLDNKNSQKKYRMTWQLILGPTVYPHKKGKKIILFHNNRKLAWIKLPFAYVITPVYVSSDYRQKKSSHALRANILVQLSNTFISHIGFYLLILLSNFF